MKHIPTLTIFFYSEDGQYSYQYDDIDALIQEEGMFLTLGEALNNAALKLKTFTFIGIENK